MPVNWVHTKFRDVFNREYLFQYWHMIFHQNHTFSVQNHSQKTTTVITSISYINIPVHLKFHVWFMLSFPHNSDNFQYCADCLVMGFISQLWNRLGC